jgi:hypothetical protein
VKEHARDIDELLLQMEIMCSFGGALSLSFDIGALKLFQMCNITNDTDPIRLAGAFREGLNV